MVARGHFQLYTSIEPPLTAGTYRFTGEQVLGSDDLDSDDLRVEKLETHVRVRSPLYVMPPDQVLSTFPPAGREGAFGSRLPQIVLKRRTLPWERDVDPANPGPPWLALVVIAEGEAELKPNQPVAECVTPGRTVPGLADSQTGNCLHIRKSMVDRVFPTREEVHLLAHAREVDITDTELMMGDDDGFLSVVIANRLPLPGKAAPPAEGEPPLEDDDVPVKYLACLVNLCGQFDLLLEKAPQAPSIVLDTLPPLVALATDVTLAQQDHLIMDTLRPQALDVIPKAIADGRTVISRNSLDPQVASAHEAVSGWGAGERLRGTADVYAELARDFVGGKVAIDPSIRPELLDPMLRFPVLIHWSFTSIGDETFQVLMENLDSGLLGTRPDPSAPANQRPKPPTGRLPLEVVDTGHVGLPHRLRRGDEVRSWYRGPLVPHPPDTTRPRLSLAHASDQLRIVIPDGREDVSLAAAFEIGRLLGLSRPSMVAALMRWRQDGFQRSRLVGILDSGILSDLKDVLGDLDRFVGGRLGAEVARLMVESPEAIVGNPAPLVTAGRPVLEDASVNSILSTGFGISAKAFEGEQLEVLQQLRTADVRLPQQDVVAGSPLIRQALTPLLERSFARVSVQALAPDLATGAIDPARLGDLPLDLAAGLSAVPSAGLGGQLTTPVLGGLAFHEAVAGGGVPHGKAVGDRAGSDPLDDLIARGIDLDADEDEEEDW